MKKTDGQIRLCLCGCGTELQPDDRGRPRNWVRGHGHKGKKHSPEWCEKQAEGLKRAWADPLKMVTIRKHSPELIEKRIRHLRGRKHSAEQNAAASRRMTGRKLKPETIAKLRAMYPNGIVPLLSPESEERRAHSISVQRTGTHGYGRSARDNPQHFNALHWVVRDPVGRIYEFENSQAWARKNETLFMPDDHPDSKLPLWRRFVSGLNGMQRTDKKGQHSWRGWVLVSVIEREVIGAAVS